MKMIILSDNIKVVGGLMAHLLPTISDEDIISFTSSTFQTKKGDTILTVVILVKK